MKLIFNTKFDEDYDKNGKEIEILEYLGNDMYLIRFLDTKEILRVYNTEIKEVN